LRKQWVFYYGCAATSLVTRSMLGVFLAGVTADEAVVTADEAVSIMLRSYGILLILVDSAWSPDIA
jgi:hypothetical protein